ncbi:MAG: phosphate ABC transporter substrate-binding protein [Candidatus Omnitrophica bacterium]|nr:phosphate ABC transporter substrate-binding protein [Candidatus Omnitrophota bacterium]MCF7891482.1 phosphate ABC transporter substrate-binding protein [Candidatus Omnitrophota bacterium]MCF7897146.1 phosphate ABC transporter substrate-binding protein [Candidatus Omnitrophota bacterium]MCF7908955.1 phosphate ABC transporter substrate-binding protein [Candidatus Omnitrophota bacterium]
MKNIRKLFLAAVLILGLTGSAFTEDITIKGSTTVYPVAQATAEKFMDMHPEVRISIQGGGSGFGIAAIIDGTTDIGNASRPIKDKEIKKALSKGIDPKAHVVALDGIAVVVNPSNSVSALTKQQIKDIYTGKTSNWSEIGGSGGRIVVISRDSASGTFETFNKLALDKERVRPDALLQASNQAVATTVTKTPGAIGYVGLGYLTSKVKGVDVNGVEASKDTVRSGEYSLARPLFMYTDGPAKGAVKKYLDFVTSSEGQRLAEKQGYVGLK